MFQYRHYEAGDEENLVDLWNQSLTKDPITAKRFRQLVLLDANFDPKGLRLVFENEQMIGCAYGIRRLLPMYGTDLEEDNGWIPFFFVHPEFHNQGIGTRLLEEVITFFHSASRKNIYFASYAPNYILPGIDEKAYPAAFKFLQKQGFEQLYSPVAMDRNLVNYEYPQEVRKLRQKRLKENYTFSQAADGDLYEVIQFANQVFNPDWGRAIREGVLQGLPMERIIVARKERKVVGFCIYGGYEGIPERFGPFGVAPDQQGKGLGKILLHEALQSMRSEGLHGAWFLWTGEKTAAGYLYKKTGFSVTRQFHVMKKTLS